MIVKIEITLQMKTQTSPKTRTTKTNRILPTLAKCARTTTSSGRRSRMEQSWSAFATTTSARSIVWNVPVLSVTLSPNVGVLPYPLMECKQSKMNLPRKRSSRTLQPLRNATVRPNANKGAVKVAIVSQNQHSRLLTNFVTVLILVWQGVMKTVLVEMEILVWSVKTLIVKHVRCQTVWNAQAAMKMNHVNWIAKHALNVKIVTDVRIICAPNAKVTIVKSVKLVQLITN